MLRWARENRCPWDELTCRYAAQGGHLEVLRWAREHDCPWSAQTCDFAAQNGQLETLRWAREHNCPWWGLVDVARHVIKHILNPRFFI